MAAAAEIMNMSRGPMKWTHKVAALLAVVFGWIALGSADAEETRSLPRVGYLVSQDADYFFQAFQQRMRELGYIEGRTVRIERRSAEGRLDKMPALVAEFLQTNVDVLVTPNVVATAAAKKLTTTVPIVMVSAIDPVLAGYVGSLARPGGNVTGIATLSRTLSAKRLEILREILPKLSNVAILWDADAPGPQVAFKNYQAAAQLLTIRVVSLTVSGPTPAIEEAMKTSKAAEAAIVVADPLMTQHLNRITAVALTQRIPLMSEHVSYVDAGALVSYGPKDEEIGQRLAVYVDRILKGAKAGDLPVEQPTRFDLALNLKTAKSLGTSIPQSLLIRADHLLE